ncbi:hypothetical protein ACIHDR_47225 [Nocardia sp. NPDC052278]|uniref:hypothetical protein n=1 Tax=unclassified Nocardia TaxID=2637762 RepID=UPI0036BA42E1
MAHVTVHEKLTATAVHPFVDNVMISPPTNRLIIDELPQLPDTLAAVVDTLNLIDAALHIELRLHNRCWHVIDVGVRPGAGLVAHAAWARTGVDPRVAHLAACLSRPLSADVLATAAGPYPATCIACCYVAPQYRPGIRMQHHSALADTLRANSDVIGWHLNLAEVDDEVYQPDAGLSIGIGAPDIPTALHRLRSLVGPYAYTTTASAPEPVAAQP